MHATLFFSEKRNDPVRPNPGYAIVVCTYNDEREPIAFMHNIFYCLLILTHYQ